MRALERLFQPDAPPVQRFGGDDAAWTGLVAAARAQPDTRVRLLDGARIATGAALFRELAEALAFPPHFGHNWDALDECLHDLEWIPESSLLLAFGKADRLLAEEPDGLAILLAILGSAARELQEPEMGNVCLRRMPIALRVLLQVEEEGMGALRTRAGRVLPDFG